MTLILLLFGTAWGVHLGIRHALEEAKLEIWEEYQRIDRQGEYWDCLQSMLAEAVAWVDECDPADWWKYGDAAPS
jgi:hypothetical protein